ncbi:hypothetical protein C493_11822 [Natronolimnohabitans innermongolicus JCM 12255]|uniref:DUF8173 domain-containing protein n=1 Tax=Natronolimnohabitans innermongolicus JCM 12255 TaxID=1227499 RepID=L9WZX9_9EURY|nr:hypothetical protein C493_11822 [Natronolimnohabitans innermongolicus JCM 12255]
MLVALVVLVVLVVGALPATVAAQSVADSGGTVVVEEGETVDELEAFAGTVVVEGTVTGDLSAVAGDVRIEGEVGGDAEIAAGSVTIEGTVEGDLEAAGGSVTIADGGDVGGDLLVGAASVAIDGTVAGDAGIGAETIQLGDDAEIAGDLRYDGTLEGNTDAVAGEITEDSSIGVDIAPTVPSVASALFALYTLVLNLLLGAALLWLFPRFSGRVASRVATDPVRTGLAGLGLLVGVPILLVATAITVIGIPFAVIGGFAFAFVVWVGIVYGRFAVAAWLLSLVDVTNRWLALVVGMIAGAALTQIPYLGGLLNFVVFLLGLGALGIALYAHRKAARERDREARGEVGAGGPAS